MGQGEKTAPAGRLDGTDELVDVHLSMTMLSSEVERLLGDHYRPGRPSGITVESLAANLCRDHRAVDGYIRWTVSPIGGSAPADTRASGPVPPAG